MRPLDWEPEVVSKTGSVMSKGVLNQLGRPNIDMLAVLLREAVQNSWDARVSDDRSIEFGLAGWELNKSQHEFLTDVLFAQRPDAALLPLATKLVPLQKSMFDDDPFYVLAIYDRGTVGLGGPTRADIPVSPGEPRDFVNFLRNVGQPPDRQLSGGTYGYGKSAFYLSSQAQTICVHTRCHHQGAIESRFIAAALGDNYNDGRQVYTGRHWWGYSDGDIVQPITGEPADDIAHQLGMPEFIEQERGTTILVLQPRWGESRQPHQAINYLAQQMLYYFWPKMLRTESGNAPINFAVRWQGQSIDVPHPEEFPPLKGFVQAMEYLKSTTDERTVFRRLKRDIGSDRPKQQLGTLALQQFPRLGSSHFDTGSENGNDDPFADLTHHTALMRQPELVVKYLPGMNMLNDKVGYAGVFITDAEVDTVFAKSEPPTHDNWESKWLTGSEKTFVNVALRRIREYMDEFAKPIPRHSDENFELTPLGAFANTLGETLLPAQEGSSAALFRPPPKVPPANSQWGRPQLPVPQEQEKPPFDESKSSSPTPTTAPGLFDTPQRPAPTIEPPPPFIPPPPLSQPYTPPPPRPEAESSYNPQDNDERARFPERGSPNSERPDHSVPSQPQPTYEEPPTPKPSPPPPIIGKPKLRLVSDDYVVFDTIQVLQISFEIAHARNSSGTLVRPIARVVLDGGQLEAEPPEGSTLPRVVGWLDPYGNDYGADEAFFIEVDVDGVWSAFVSLLEDAALDVDFELEARGYDDLS